jgi:CHAT domain-containing protein
LYEWLVRPVERSLGPVETPIVLVVDGSLAAVPFAALHDSRRGRYLIEDHPVRFAVSLTEAARPSPASTPGRALFVADPTFDARENPLLDRLAHARVEMRQVAAGYPVPTVLEGPAATRAALTKALPHSTVAHFAGHAVFDDSRPERSYLVLAPAPTDPVGRLTAADLGRLDLHGVQLVVLSACRTVRGGRSRAAGYTGLSGALLAAGVGGTVGSTWDVDDRSTATLMSAFHHVYQRLPDGTKALRAAQLTLLRSGDPARRTPAAWAGFRYAGN